MHIKSPSKRFLAGILLFIQLLTSCLSPSIGPDKSSLEPVEEQTTSHSSSIVASTKQEDKAQELALKTPTQEKAPLAADKQTLNLQSVEEARSNEEVNIKEQGHVVGHQTKIIQGLEVKRKLVNHQTATTDTVPQAIIFNQKNLNEGKENKKMKTSDLISSPLGDLGRVSRDILKIIFSYLGSKHMGKVRQLSKALYQLTTGYEVPGIVGVAHKRQANMLTSGLGINKKVVNFRKLGKLRPEKIPSCPWYQLVGEVQHLPRCFWPYITGAQVHTLHLGYNRIGDEGVAELAKALPSTQVHTLYLQGNQISDEGASELAKALPSTQVHTLDLGSNQIDTQGLKELAKALPSTQVHTLHLDNNGIGDEGAKELAAALPSTQVHTLHLYHNDIDDKGAKELSKTLTNTQVHTLHLGGNQIGAKGAAKLAKALPSAQVHTLDLQSTQIGAEGVKKLAAALSSTQVHILRLGGNQIGYEGVAELAKALPSTQVHTLYLGDNQIGDEGVAELAKALPNTRVNTLYLGDNQIGNEMQKLLMQENPNIICYF